MKKKFLLMSILMGVSVFGYSKIDCEIEGHGNVASIEVSFDDEDCVTKEFTYTHYFLDGTVEEGVSTEDDAPWGEMDFGAFDCCEHV